ncbi:MAG: squalene/phytoene synthase family protein [Verrucomicrobiae bacterium]|nr:squalene/phytoene synthase family protein [Verrucomicrobiae bacterium]
MTAEANALPIELLRRTSRSFYLTLRVLPEAVRHQIGIAYLLARTADTIADTELLPARRRLEALRALRERIVGRSDAPIAISEFATRAGTEAERALLEQAEASLALLGRLSPSDLKLVRWVLDIIITGQERDLTFFGPGGNAQPAQVKALRDDGELDDYTYRVAGCVGEFWTKLCRAHLFPEAQLDDEKLLADGVRYGRGLQLVNVLRDLAADLRRGRCYLPATRLADAGLDAASLLEPANEQKLRPIYNSYLARAAALLDSGWAYTNALPRRQVRLRLACSWPILIGLKTLGRLRTSPVLDPAYRVKVSRAEVYRTLVLTIVCYPFPGLWTELYRAAAAPVRTA